MKSVQLCACITVFLTITTFGVSQLASLYSFRAACEYRTFRNTVGSTLPVLGGYCRCPGFSPGVSFVTDRGQFDCVQQCYQSIHKTECKRTMKSDSKALFSSCCTSKCSGILVPDMPYTEYKGNKPLKDLGCAASKSSPSPTPVFCPYNAFTNELSFDPPVVGGYCRCKSLFGDRFTPGISFPVSRPLYRCTLKCMNELQDTDCNRNMKSIATAKFKSCCRSCDGTTTELAYFEQRRDLLKKDLGCLAPLPQRETLPPAKELSPTNDIGLQFSNEVNAAFLAEIIREELIKYDPSASVLTIAENTLDAFLYELDTDTTTFSTLERPDASVRMLSAEIYNNSYVSDVLRIRAGHAKGSVGASIKTNTNPRKKGLSAWYNFAVNSALASKKGKKAKSVYDTRKGKTIKTGKGKLPARSRTAVRITSLGNGVHYIYVPFNAAYRKKNNLPEIPE